MRRFELPTPWSVAKCSIQLSYIHMFECRRPESNRYGRLVPQDFKSCASASSATPALNGTNRARTCDPLLVRQVLSQLSYDPMGYVIVWFFYQRPRRDSNPRPPP